MTAIFKSLYAIGLTSLLATPLAYGETKGLAHCGGIFLLDSDTKELNGTFCHVADTAQVNNYSAFASFSHYRIDGLWKDGWELSLNSNRMVGSAGIQANFRNITFSVEASSMPTLKSSVSIHTADSSLYAAALVERGNPELATIRWESENENDEVHLIEGDWNSQYLRKGFTAGARFASNELTAGLQHIGTTPYNAKREYFIKDSSRIWLWNAQYAHHFETSKLDFYYAGASADVNIFGNTWRDNSTKRFMFVPLDVSLHYGSVQWEKETFGLDARGIKADVHMERNKKRFFETFAPNRLLPVSIMQTLSFSFLQKNFLVDADIDLSAVTLGGHINPRFNITTHTKVSPRIDLHGYYTYDEIEVNRTSSTTSFIGYSAQNDSMSWMLESYGLVAGLGITLERETQGILRNLSLFASATQIVPLKTDYTERTETPESTPATPPEGTPPAKNKNAGLESGGIFRSGFAAHFGVSISF